MEENKSEMSDLEKLRHSAAHVLAQAVKELFPETKLGIGPVIEDGFYYDFGRKEPFTNEDLKKLEDKMKEISKQNLKIEKVELSEKEINDLKKREPFKKELMDDLEKKKIKPTFYKQGNFVDLCRGPHVNYTAKVKAFKLMKVSGAYWKGNQENEQMQRIYGTCWPTKDELDAYLNRLVEAEKRDHRKLGKDQDLFLFSDLVGPGLPLWTPKGTILRDLVDGFVWELRKSRGYMKVTIPHFTKKELYLTSGHWQKYADDLFKIKTRDGHEFAIKPMNCPHHTQIFGHIQRSYREMPHRYAETTMVYRDEQTGELAGLSRVLCITQDDAHVFCRESQVKEECFKIWDIINTFYGAFGFKLVVRLSLHDPHNFEKYVGTKELWQKSEEQLRAYAQERNVPVIEAIGEAAFYGPKLDFIAQDSIGRKWQVATIQIDRNMPERFDLSCINEKGDKERIVMIHAAIMGSIERFLSVLIEHLAGKFPLWLSPVQVRLLTVTDRAIPFAEEVMEELKKSDIRAELDSRTETIPKKVRDAQVDHIPLMVTIGDKEAGNKTLAVRTLDGKVKFGVKPEEFLKLVIETIKERSLEIKL